VAGTLVYNDRQSRPRGEAAGPTRRPASDAGAIIAAPVAS